MSAGEQPQAVTRAEFARILGVKRSYITALAKADRLVLTPDGRKVVVAASQARIHETRDPNRDDVAQRHAAARGAQPSPAAAPTIKPTASAVLPAPPPEDGAAGDGSEDYADPSVQSFQASRARKEHYAAERARIEYEREIGELCSTQEVRTAAHDFGALIVSHLERIPDQLAPILADERDEGRIHILITEHLEALRTDLAQQLERITGGMS